MIGMYVAPLFKANQMYITNLHLILQNIYLRTLKMSLLGPKTPLNRAFFTFFKYRHVAPLLKANQMYITNLHFILQNIHLSTPK